MAQSKKSSAKKSNRKTAAKGAKRTGRPPNLVFKGNIVLAPTDNLTQKQLAALKSDIERSVAAHAKGYGATLRKASLVKEGDGRGKAGKPAPAKKGAAVKKAAGKGKVAKGKKGVPARKYTKKAAAPASAPQA